MRDDGGNGFPYRDERDSEARHGGRKDDLPIRSHVGNTDLCELRLSEHSRANARPLKSSALTMTTRPEREIIIPHDGSEWMCGRASKFVMIEILRR
jgi:hypothetical protein